MPLPAHGVCQPRPTQFENLDIELDESDSLRFKLVANFMASNGVGQAHINPQFRALLTKGRTAFRTTTALASLSVLVIK